MNLADRSSPHFSVGCVKFLNTKPLVDGIEAHRDVRLHAGVPSALLQDLLRGFTDIALCPVIDYQRSPEPLAIVPVSAIGCDGPTMTVRLVSRVPIDRIATVHADTDSHTSVVLSRIILHDGYGLTPQYVDLPPQVLTENADLPDTLLLIGDKVVTHHPPAQTHPHVLDLGEAWHEQTGLPFVFAVWMAKLHTPLGDLPARLDALRQANAQRLDEIVAQHAGEIGWPTELALAYLTDRLVYDVGPRQRQAMQLYWQRAAVLGQIDELRPMIIHTDACGSSVS